MKKSLVLSLFVVHALNASGVDLGQISVEDSHKKETIKDVASEDIKSADLGEALMKNSASVAIVRRSAISNDIIVRGQKKDNINVTIDGAKVALAINKDVPHRERLSHSNQGVIDG